MRTDLDHLPTRQRLELERILEIIFAEFAEALKGKLSDQRKTGRILKVILFGSYARGNWVDDRRSGYKSDFDILVVVNKDEFAGIEYWDWTEERLLQELMVTKRIRREVNIIRHSLADVNDQLAKGRYFFTDIVREGIVLYEAKGYLFAEPQALSPDAAREEADIFFKQRFPNAAHFLELAQISIQKQQPNAAAFLLHQATEGLYHCTLLVHTLYSPASHNIKYLRSLCDEIDPRLIEVWPRTGRLAQGNFERLKRAYVEARYSRHYRITDEELAWLAERVGLLRDTVRVLCEERLARQPLKKP